MKQQKEQRFEKVVKYEDTPDLENGLAYLFMGTYVAIHLMFIWITIFKYKEDYSNSPWVLFAILSSFITGIIFIYSWILIGNYISTKKVYWRRIK